MMNEEEKFDDLLRKKMSERDFFFDEENWLKASEQIERDERKRKARRVALIFISGLALGIALTIPIMNMVINNQQNKTVTASNTQGSTTASTQNNGQIATTENNRGKTEVVNNTPSQNTVSTNTQPASVGNNNAEVNKDNTLSKEPSAYKATSNTSPAIAGANTAKKQRSHKESVASALVASNNTPHLTKPNHSIPTTPETANNRTTSGNNSTNPNSRVVASANTPTRHHKGNKQFAYNTVTVHSKQVTTPPNEFHIDAPTVPSEQTATSNSDQQPTANKNGVTTPVSTKETNEVVTNSVNPSENNKATSTTSGAPATQSASEPATTKNLSDSGNKTTTASNTAPVSTTVNNPPAIPARASTIIGIDAGGGYSLGWKSGDTSQANGLSPLFGVTITHFFSKKIALSAGMDYTNLTKLKTSYSNSTTTYDFGASYTATTITPKTLHYAMVPLTLQYYINDNNAICVGASVLYLINTSSTVTTSTQNDLNPMTSQSKTSMGYTDGFNKLDMQARLAYRRRIYKSFSASIEGYYGLLDIEENSFFSSNTFQRNSGFRLILSYDLIK
jgi:hypothetical protein